MEIIKKEIMYIDFVVLESLAQIVNDHGLIDVVHLYEIFHILVQH